MRTRRLPVRHSFVAMRTTTRVILLVGTGVCPTDPERAVASGAIDGADEA